MMWKIKLFIRYDPPFPDVLKKLTFYYVVASIKTSLTGYDAKLETNAKDYSIYLEYETDDEQELERVKEFQDKLNVDFDALVNDEIKMQQLAQQNKIIKKHWEGIKHKIKHFKELSKTSFKVDYEIEKL